ncbi:MAG: tetratricopeptide repeat protein [Armatimonadota bacterium]
MSESDNDIEEQLRRDRIDRLTTAATVFRNRGDVESALTACQELLALDPENLDAREILADVLVENQKHDQAMAEYRRIFEADPSRTSVERKIAELALREGELRHQEQRRQQLLQDPTKRDRTGGVRIGTAWLCAVICPGLGQLYLREYVKGLIILGVSLVLIALIIQHAVLAPLAAAVGTGQMTTFFEYLGQSGGRAALVLFACFVTLGLYFYGIIDAVRSVRRMQAAEEEELGI